MSVLKFKSIFKKALDFGKKKKKKKAKDDLLKEAEEAIAPVTENQPAAAEAQPADVAPAGETNEADEFDLGKKKKKNKGKVKFDDEQPEVVEFEDAQDPNRKKKKLKCSLKAIVPVNGLDLREITHTKNC